MYGTTDPFLCRQLLINEQEEHPPPTQSRPQTLLLLSGRYMLHPMIHELGISMEFTHFLYLRICRADREGFEGSGTHHIEHRGPCQGGRPGTQVYLVCWRVLSLDPDPDVQEERDFSAVPGDLARGVMALNPHLSGEAATEQKTPVLDCRAFVKQVGNHPVICQSL